MTDKSPLGNFTITHNNHKLTNAKESFSYIDVYFDKRSNGEFESFVIEDKLVKMGFHIIKGDYANEYNQHKEQAHVANTVSGLISNAQTAELKKYLHGLTEKDIQKLTKKYIANHHVVSSGDHALDDASTQLAKLPAKPRDPRQV